ncbi:MAG: hypothetical protein M3355_01625 [Actinomycetota bacterium]|nr:hypothetical protein [Actinomycetota bacterium]
MRTTLNIDADIAQHLSELARERDRSLSRVANEVLQVGLRTIDRAALPTPFEPRVHDTGRPLIDVTDTAEALDVLNGG